MKKGNDIAPPCCILLEKPLGDLILLTGSSEDALFRKRGWHFPTLVK
jgi:selenophosphate synthase